MKTSLLILCLFLGACASPYERSKEIEQSALIESYVRACPNGVTYYNRSSPVGWKDRGYVSQVDIRCASTALPHY